MPRCMKYINFNPCAFDHLAVFHRLCSVECVFWSVHRRYIQAVIFDHRKFVFACVNRHRKGFEEIINPHDVVEMSMRQKQCFHFQSTVLDVIDVFLRTFCHIHCKTFLRLFISYNVAIRSYRAKYNTFNLHSFSLHRLFFYRPVSSYSFIILFIYRHFSLISLLFSQYRSRFRSV